MGLARVPSKLVSLVRAGSEWHRESLALSGQERSRSAYENRSSSPSTVRTWAIEVAWGRVQVPIRLPRALRALAHEAVVTEDGPRPLRELKPLPPGASLVVLAGRATRVP